LRGKLVSDGSCDKFRIAQLGQFHFQPSSIVYKNKCTYHKEIMPFSYFNPLTSEDLLNHKALVPLTDQQIDRIKEIASLDVSKFKEASVRAHIIDPIVRILGYTKIDESFKPEEERSIKFQHRNNEIDYSLTFWEKDFWIIEAKRPRNSDNFPKEDFYQAIRYSAHPEINAAIFILCDGIRFQIWDREFSLKEPIETIKICELEKEFDKIRALLAPWNAWFFQKRRVLRNFQSTIELEMNYKRAEELKEEVRRQFDTLRPKILNNYRREFDFKKSNAERVKFINSCDEATIIEVYFFENHPAIIWEACSDRLVELYKESNSFQILHRMLPDHTPRPVNEHYFAHVLHFLITLKKSGVSQIRYAPKALSNNNFNVPSDIDLVIHNLIKHCLTNFVGFSPYNLILKYSMAARRLSKLMILNMPFFESLGKMQHALTRFYVDEKQPSQIYSSNAGQMLNILTTMQLGATAVFVRNNQDKNREFKTQAAKNQINDVINTENQLMKSGFDFEQACKDLELNEIQDTKILGTKYDPTAHSCLCILTEIFQDYQDSLKANFNDEILFLARMGSWSALKLLGYNRTDSNLPKLSDDELSNYFGFEDKLNFIKLLRNYE